MNKVLDFNFLSIAWGHFKTKDVNDSNAQKHTRVEKTRIITSSSFIDVKRDRDAMCRNRVSCKYRLNEHVNFSNGP